MIDINKIEIIIIDIQTIIIITMIIEEEVQVPITPENNLTRIIRINKILEIDLIQYLTTDKIITKRINI
jgi:hypothetical protein